MGRDHERVLQLPSLPPALAGRQRPVDRRDRLPRREQVVFQQFKQTATRSLEYIRKRHGARDPRVLTLRSIIATCEIAEALMQLVLNAVTSALGDSESILTKAVNTAFKVGVGLPARALRLTRTEEEEAEDEDDGLVLGLDDDGPSTEAPRAE